MYTRDRCCEEGEIRSAKCPCVEVRMTRLVTRDHELMRERDGQHGNKEGEMGRGGKLEGEIKVVVKHNSRKSCWV